MHSVPCSAKAPPSPGGDGELDGDLADLLERAGRPPRIRCPKCRWQPRAHDRWQCTCRHVWNTFDTRGVCPACAYAWKTTACLRCRQWSPHEDWYERDDGGRAR
jgi:hypothetical protein